MFDTFAGLLSSIPTFLFPVFASYKALKTSDPALLIPWLMYWVVLACTLFFESWTGFILKWIPFYAWIRLGFLLYLILPQTQGAKVLYNTHVHPFLEKNEHTIDEFISSAHDRAKSAGANYFKQVVEYIKQNLLGFPPKEPTPPQTPTKLGYTQSLMARFNLPTSKNVLSGNSIGNSTNSVTDIYSLLASAVSGVTFRDPSSKNFTGSLSSGASSAERLSFISTQRERLVSLLSALEKEAIALQTDLNNSSSQDALEMPPGKFSGDMDEIFERLRGSVGGLIKSHSEADFEKIEVESTVEESDNPHTIIGNNAKSGSWLPWSWRAQVEETQAGSIMKGTQSSMDKGKSSSIDL